MYYDSHDYNYFDVKIFSGTVKVILFGTMSNSYTHITYLCPFFIYINSYIHYRLVRLFLEPNERLIGDNFVWQIRDDSESITFKEKSPRRCHYMHRIHHGRSDGNDVTAAFTYCPGSSKVTILICTYIKIEFKVSLSTDYKFIMFRFQKIVPSERQDVCNWKIHLKIIIIVFCCNTFFLN